MGKGKYAKKTAARPKPPLPTGCARPNNGCLFGKPVRSEEHEVCAQKLACSNGPNCNAESLYIHSECMEEWVEALVDKMKNGKGRGGASTWSNSQRHNNLWKKEGYHFVYRDCKCVCGGFLKPAETPARKSGKMPKNGHNNAPLLADTLYPPTCARSKHEVYAPVVARYTTGQEEMEEVRPVPIPPAVRHRKTSYNPPNRHPTKPMVGCSNLTGCHLLLWYY